MKKHVVWALALSVAWSVSANADDSKRLITIIGVPGSATAHSDDAVPDDDAGTNQILADISKSLGEIKASVDANKQELADLRTHLETLANLENDVAKLRTKVEDLEKANGNGKQPVSAPTPCDQSANRSRAQDSKAANCECSNTTNARLDTAAKEIQSKRSSTETSSRMMMTWREYTPGVVVTRSENNLVLDNSLNFERSFNAATRFSSTMSNTASDDNRVKVFLTPQYRGASGYTLYSSPMVTPSYYYADPESTTTSTTRSYYSSSPNTISSARTYWVYP